MAGLLFELKQVHYSYLGRIPALCAINLTIEEGSRVAIIGANGSGKSTLLTMLDALIFPEKGTLSVFGREMTEKALADSDFSHRFRSSVGFVFQNPDVQLFCPTVKEDILFGPLQLGVSHAEINRRLEAIVMELKITHLLERSPHQLSIGEKRKVAIGSVLAIQPDVLLLDEPTAGLDPQTTRDIIDIFLTENAARKTIISATHDMHIIEEIADTVHVFGAGKNIIRSGRAHDILSDQQFLQDNNLVHIHRHEHKGKIHTHPHLHTEHHSHNSI